MKMKMQKIKNKIYFQKKYLFFVICSILFHLISCSTTRYYDRQCYKTIFIDSTFFKEYYFMQFFNEDGHNVYLISSKAPKHEISSFKFDTIKYGNEYCFKISKIDTFVNATLLRPITSENENLYLDNELIWSKGKIKVPVYKSDKIVNKYFIRN